MNIELNKHNDGMRQKIAASNSCFEAILKRVLI